MSNPLHFINLYSEQILIFVDLIQKNNYRLAIFTEWS